MTDILRLPDWTPTSVDDTAERMTIHAEYTKQPDACQVCGVVNASLYKHGHRQITFLDIPYGKPTRLAAKAQRYRCRECDGIFVQPLGSTDTARRMTQRCLAYIGRRCLVDTFQRVSEDLGCDEKTVRNVAIDYIGARAEDYQPYLPEWIGLDETHLNQIFRAIITDVGNRRPVDLLPNRDKGTIARWFLQFPESERAKVKGLAIDMWPAYRDLAGQLFKDLPVVIDKFHVVKKANESVERTRIRLGKDQVKGVRRSWMRSKALLRMRYRDLTVKQRFNLDMWLDNEPEMAVSYRLKERLFDLYDKPKTAAIQDYDGYASAVPDSLKSDFKELLSAMKNWRKEILNYFDYPITNAYTEGVNGVAKVMNRMGRGYSFDVIRARVLFNDKKPSARQLRAQKIDATLYRCGCCNGLFEGREMDANRSVLASVRAFDPDHAKEGHALLFCRECEDRFYLEKTTHCFSLPTT